MDCRVAFLVGLITFGVSAAWIWLCTHKTKPLPERAGGKHETAWKQVNISFVVFALVFLAFDMEMIFMFPWAVAFMPQILGVRNPDCVGIERQIGKTSTVSANWINLSTRHMLRSIDTNAPPPPNYSARPDSALGQNQQFQSEGVLTGNALELT